MIRLRVRAAGRGIVPDAVVRPHAPLAANGKASLVRRKPGGAD